MGDILSQANKGARPEANVSGDFQCQQCYTHVGEGHYDASKKLLTWYCENDHRSAIEEFTI